MVQIALIESAMLKTEKRYKVISIPLCVQIEEFERCTEVQT